MSLLSRLERSLGRYAIQDLTLYLVCGQAGTFIMSMAHPRVLQSIALIPRRVVEDGEWWRVLTFPFFPPTTNVIFAIMALGLMFTLGRILENHWGTFRYNVYLLIAYLASIAGAFLAHFAGGEGYATSAYFSATIFLAAAMVVPDFTILVFFILPVQIKWLALATWLFYGYSFATGDVLGRAMIVASVVNFLLFFWRDIIQLAKTGRRRMHRQMQRKIIPRDDVAFHTCATCGITDKTHPKMDFRYCPGCGGQLAYCTEHLHNHEHRVVPRKD